MRPRALPQGNRCILKIEYISLLLSPRKAVSCRTGVAPRVVRQVGDMLDRLVGARRRGNLFRPHRSCGMSWG
jgi:hypothetical protein